MTATAIAWIITITLWAGILALVGVAALNRAFRRHHSHGRHPRPAEPPSPATATRPWRLPMFLVRRTLRDRTPEHEGATEEFRDELRALRHLPVAPELAPVLTEVEIRTEVHEDLDQIMSAFRHDLDHILDGICRQLDPLWARVDYPTGEYAAVGG